MAEQRFEKSYGIAYAIPYGVAVHLRVGGDSVGGIAHEYRITIDREGQGCWVVALELTLPSGPVRARKVEASSEAAAEKIRVELEAEMQRKFTIVRGGSQ